ncbi:MAG: PAS domain S-box protein [Thermales bacterium]|nr:PAS domain S-box protein [Thermales bacterium]
MILIFFDNIHPDHELNLISSFKELINKKSKRRIKIYSKIKNSKINGFGSNIFLVINFKTRHIDGVLIHVNDVNQAKQNEILLQTLDQKLKILLQNTVDLIFIKDLNGKIVEINESFSKFFGKTKKNFLGKYESEVFNKKEKEILKMINL